MLIGEVVSEIGNIDRTYLVALSAEAQGIGKTLQSTKTRYTWKIEIVDDRAIASGGRRDYKLHILEMTYSRLSGKKKVSFDGVVRYSIQTPKSSAFEFNMVLEGRLLSIVPQGDDYVLRIDGMAFEFFEARPPPPPVLAKPISYPINTVRSPQDDSAGLDKLSPPSLETTAVLSYAKGEEDFLAGAVLDPFGDQHAEESLKEEANEEAKLWGLPPPVAFTDDT
ncbi:hypothetical protein FOL47_006418 [Perkinsus chesapeaki]|uniref:Uncharacterized protein n=1 Tax=Perkinsus chesapeaki TaxID=330153 RepID=A0A7J6LS30_PERCH|nr:hypothetical protein FOL47_006418 [Perkinsus chesapeaki]